MHFFYAFAEDANYVPAGPLGQLINYLPDPAHIHASEQQDYSYALGAGDALDLRLDSTTQGGDADVYLWAVDPTSGKLTRLGASNRGPGQEDGIHLSVPWTTVYEIEIYGYVETDYRLRIEVNGADVTAGGTDLTKPLQGLPLMRPASQPHPPLTHHAYLPLVASQ